MVAMSRLLAAAIPAACWFASAESSAASKGGLLLHNHGSSDESYGGRQMATISPLGFKGTQDASLFEPPAAPTVRPGDRSQRLIRSVPKGGLSSGVKLLSTDAELEDTSLRRLLGDKADLKQIRADPGVAGNHQDGELVLVNMASYDGCANVMLSTGGNRSSLHSAKGAVESFEAQHKQTVLVGCFTVECKTPAEWANTAMGGKKFTFLAPPVPIHEIAVFAMEDTKVDMYIDGELNLTIPDIFAGRLQTWGGNYTGKSIDLVSTGNVLVMAVAEAHYMGKYLYPIPPAANEIYGGVSRKVLVSVHGGESAEVSMVCTDGSTETKTGSQMTFESDDVEYAGKSCKLSAADGKLIGAATIDDGSSQDGTSWLPSHLWQTITPVPMDMKWLKIVSNQETTCQLDLWDKHTEKLDTSNTTEFTLSGKGDVWHYRLTDVAALSVLQCDGPYMIFGDDARTEAEIQLITADNPVAMDSYIKVHQHQVKIGQSALPTFNQAALHKRPAKDKKDH